MAAPYLPPGDSVELLNSGSRSRRGRGTRPRAWRPRPRVRRGGAGAAPSPDEVLEHDGEWGARARKWVEESCAAQGLPVKISDPTRRSASRRGVVDDRPRAVVLLELVVAAAALAYPLELVPAHQCGVGGIPRNWPQPRTTAPLYRTGVKSRAAGEASEAAPLSRPQAGGALRLQGAA